MKFRFLFANKMANFDLQLKIRLDMLDYEVERQMITKLKKDFATEIKCTRTDLTGNEKKSNCYNQSIEIDFTPEKRNSFVGARLRN